ncbi:DnaJ family domain-containing protein [Filibacter tadaridae]|uniref:DnaJ homologue subfamily C member 28 conserved domain-containing protein n=1 Tax=Filibacter tadaridae TaxID=2483811 RepID=A0A3P5XWH0_9BACL|nr:DnaJ family domain-containing protein [Filibacter tadaridae]VDC33512.1 hypothetical protein FILTAD_02922 [Filibacter tadaridae]
MELNEDKLNPPYQDWMGDILKEHAKTGGMDNLKGQGQPLSEEYFAGDTFQHFQRIAKDAGYKPHWLKLQHEIREEINIIADNQLNESTKDIEKKIKKVNKKIVTYNKSCPPPLQKGHVSLLNLAAMTKTW